MKHFILLLMFAISCFSVNYPKDSPAEQLVKGKDGVWRDVPDSPPNQIKEETKTSILPVPIWGTRHKTAQMPDRETCITELKSALVITEKMADIRKCMFKGDAGVCEKYNRGYVIFKCTNDNILNAIY